MATDTVDHSKVLFTWQDGDEGLRAHGYVPDQLLKDADDRPQALLHEFTTRVGIDLAEVESVEAIVDLGPAEFKVRMETDEDGEPTAHPVAAPEMN